MVSRPKQVTLDKPRHQVVMDTSLSPISTPTLRESPSYVAKSNSLSPAHLEGGAFVGQRPTKATPSKCAPSSSSASRTPADDGMAAQLTSAKYLQRSIKSEKRKDVARRRLMGTMYSKQNEVARSFTFVAGERPQTDLKFPTVSQPYVNSKNTSGMRCSGIVPAHTAIEQLRDPHRPKSDTSKEKSRGATGNVLDRHGTGLKTRTHHKISLPEIIMEFNLEACMAANGRQDFEASRQETESEEDERALGVPYEDVLRKPKFVVHNPCRAKYRPVTPGLLESLNKSKVPSKVKTEQWVRSINSTRKSFCGSTYKIGNLDNSNLATPNWIYEYR